MAAVLMSRYGPSVYPSLPLQTGLVKFRDAGAAVLITWVTIVRCCCLSARRSWREAAAWTELSRTYHDLDRGLDGIWDQR
jgi:hypothetical protein